MVLFLNLPNTHDRLYPPPFPRVLFIVAGIPSVGPSSRLHELLPRRLASQQFPFLGNEFGRLVHDTVCVPPANRTRSALGIFVATGFVPLLFLLLEVILQAILAEIVTAGRHDRIVEGLAAQEAGKGKTVVRDRSHGSGVFVHPAVLVHGIDLVHESFHLFLLFSFLGALLFFPGLFQLPPAHGVPPIVQINAGISKAAKPRVLVVLANVRLVIEPAGRSNVGGCPDRSGQELVALGIALGSRLRNVLHFLGMVLNGGGGQVPLGDGLVRFGLEMMHHCFVGLGIVVVVAVAFAVAIGCTPRRPLESSSATAMLVLGTFQSLLDFPRRFPVLVVIGCLFASTKARLFRRAFRLSKHDRYCLAVMLRRRFDPDSAAQTDFQQRVKGRFR
mmetsp:Transcript_3818/g.10839  ORF Transcript_3818/g.10839 Transcript_3818/m.10839 type:complete len:388 (+) Transcript_3818:1833-2996(+)